MSQAELLRYDFIPSLAAPALGVVLEVIVYPVRKVRWNVQFEWHKPGGNVPNRTAEAPEANATRD
ncbi:hypothetical protein V2S85_20060 [Novosphingobium resinovorum]|nr:hypothetical protein [Novosphingobium resinovorum]